MTQTAFEKPDKDIEPVLPVTPIAWRVLIRPYEPPAESGAGILYADETKEAEEMLTCVGQIVAMGSECYKLTTRSGIKMSDIEPKPKVGDWIIYGTYGGQTLRTKTGVKYMIMNDDGIMGIVPDPTTFRAYI